MTARSGASVSCGRPAPLRNQGEVDPGPVIHRGEPRGPLIGAFGQDGVAARGGDGQGEVRLSVPRLGDGPEGEGPHGAGAVPRSQTAGAQRVPQDRLPAVAADRLGEGVGGGVQAALPVKLLGQPAPRPGLTGVEAQGVAVMADGGVRRPGALGVVAEIDVGAGQPRIGQHGQPQRHRAVRRPAQRRQRQRLMIPGGGESRVGAARLGEGRDGLLVAAQRAQDQPPVVGGAGMAGIGNKRAGVGVGGVSAAAQPVEQGAEVEQRAGVAGRQIRRSAPGPRGFLGPAQPVERHGVVAVIVGDGRVVADRLGNPFHGGAEGAALRRQHPEQMQGGGVVGIDLQNPAIQGFGFGQAARLVMLGGDGERLGDGGHAVVP